MVTAIFPITVVPPLATPFSYGAMPLAASTPMDSFVMLEPTGAQATRSKLDTLAGKLGSLGSEEKRLLEAGAVSPGTVAEDLVKQAEPLIRGFAARFVSICRRKKAPVDFEDIFLLTKAAFVLFVIEWKWDVDKGLSLSGFARKYFPSYLERFIADVDPVIHDLLNAKRTALLHLVGEKDQDVRRRAIDEEVARRGLNRHVDRVFDDARDSETFSIWSRLSSNTYEERERSHALILAVGYAMYDLIADPTISQRSKEAFILRSVVAGELVGKLFSVSDERTRQWEVKAAEKFRGRLQKRLIEAEFTELAEGLSSSKEVVDELRRYLTAEEMGKVMAKAGFDRARWGTMLKKSRTIVPPPPQDYKVTWRWLRNKHGVLQNYQKPEDLAGLHTADLRELIEGHRQVELVGIIQEESLRSFDIVTDANKKRGSGRYFHIVCDILVEGDHIVLNVLPTPCGLSVAVALKYLAQSKDVQVSKEILDRVDKTSKQRQRKGHRFQNHTLLATMTPWELAALSGGRDHFFLIGHDVGKGAFRCLDSVSAEGAEIPRLYFSVEMKKDASGHFHIVNTKGGGVQHVVAALEKSGVVKVSEATKTEIAWRLYRSGRGPKPDSLQELPQVA